MNKLKNIFFTLIVFFSCMFCVNASCTDEELEILKKEANNIKVTYKHLGATIDDDGVIYYNRFEINVKDIRNDFYILVDTGNNGTIKLSPIDNTIKEYFVNGTYTFDIYSNKCDNRIKQIKVHIPKFNIYSTDYLCEGIDADDFPLCGKYYEYDVSYDDFVVRVNDYRNTHTINNDAIEESDESSLLNSILEYIIKYKIYFICLLVLLLIIFIVLLIITKRKKRSVLE